MISHQSHRPFPNLRRKPSRLCRTPILSRLGVSEIPGAVQSTDTRNVRPEDRPCATREKLTFSAPRASDPTIDDNVGRAYGIRITQTSHERLFSRECPFVFRDGGK